jgi:hypothetical protein
MVPFLKCNLSFLCISCLKKNEQPVGGLLAAAGSDVESYFLSLDYCGKMKEYRRKYEKIMNPIRKST